MNVRQIKQILINKGALNFLSDEKFLKKVFKFRMHKALDLENPQTFNEKLQWLKLYNRKKEYTKMVDKYEVKDYVVNKIGNEYIIPTLAMYEKFDDIEWDKLPNQFVIKCTHDSGGLVICKDKNSMDIKKAKLKIRKSLKRNYFYARREWPYKNIKPRIIIEKYMQDNKEDDLKDYKFFCFNGIAEIILVCSNRKGTFKNTDFYDSKWNLMPFTRENHTNNPKGIEKPKNLEKMIEIAQKLSKGIPFVRVDLYEINGKVYFGELTFFPSSGFEGFNPEEYDKILGNMLKLPKKKIEGEK